MQVRHMRVIRVKTDRGREGFTFHRFSQNFSFFPINTLNQHLKLPFELGRLCLLLKLKRAQSSTHSLSPFFLFFLLT